MEKSTIATAIFAGGIIVSGVVYTGSGAIDNVKNMVSGVRDRMEQAISDNNFLQSEYDSLKNKYMTDTDTANAKLKELNDSIVAKDNKIKELEQQADNTAEQEEIQAEITRLENELTQANQEIADLEAYVQQIETETQYTAVDRSTIETTGTGLDFVPTTEAVNLDSALAYSMADYTAFTELEEAILTDQGLEFDIIGVEALDYSRSNDYVAYTVSLDSANAMQTLANDGTVGSNVQTALGNIQTGNTFFVLEDQSDSIFMSDTGRVGD